MKDFVTLLPNGFTETLSYQGTNATSGIDNIKLMLQRDFYDGDGKPINSKLEVLGAKSNNRIVVGMSLIQAYPDSGGDGETVIKRVFSFNRKDLDGKLIILGSALATAVTTAVGLFKYNFDGGVDRAVQVAAIDTNPHYYEAVLDVDANTVTVYRDGVLYSSDGVLAAAEHKSVISFEIGFSVCGPSWSSGAAISRRNQFGNVKDMYFMISDKSKGHEARLGKIELKRVNVESVSSPGGWVTNTDASTEAAMKTVLSSESKPYTSSRPYIKSDPNGRELVLRMANPEGQTISAANLYIDVMKDAGSNALVKSEVTTTTETMNVSYNPENTPSKTIHSLATPQITNAEGSFKNLEPSDVSNVVVVLKGRAM